MSHTFVRISFIIRIVLYSSNRIGVALQAATTPITAAINRIGFI